MQRNFKLGLIFILSLVLLVNVVSAVGIYGTENPSDYLYFNSFQDGTIDGSFTSSGFTIDNAQSSLDNDYSAYSSCSGDSCAYIYKQIVAPSSFCIQAETKGFTHNSQILIWSSAPPPSQVWRANHLTMSSSCGTGGFSFASSVDGCVVNDINVSDWYVHTICYEGNTWSYWNNNNLIVANSTSWLDNSPPVSQSYYVSSRRWSSSLTNETTYYDGYKVWDGTFEDKPVYGEVITPDGFTLAQHLDFEDSVIGDFTTDTDSNGEWTINDTNCREGSKCMLMDTGNTYAGDFYAYIDSPDWTFDSSDKPIITKMWARQKTDDGEGTYTGIMEGFTDSTHWYVVDGYWTQNNIRLFETYKNGGARVLSELGSITAVTGGSDYAWIVTEYNDTTAKISFYEDMTETNLLRTETTTKAVALGEGFVGLYAIRSAYFDDVYVFESNETTPIIPITTDLVNNSLNYINETFTVSYDSVGSEGLFDCDLYLDDVLNQSDPSLNLSDTQEFVITFGAVEESHTLEISCEGGENKTTGVINFAVDGLQPRAIVNSPDDEVEFTYLIGTQDLDVDVDFQNINLQETNVTIKNSTNDIVYNEYDNLTGLNLTEYNVAFTIDINTLPVGEYSIEFYARDQLYERLKVQTFTISLCPEVWVVEYSSCNISDEQILTYTDSNSCGTTNDLPVDDNSVVECNYCTPTYEQTTGDCSGQSERLITYDYTNTCCDTTGLETDCNIPANTTESCIGIHQSSDISGLVIDGGVELGREYIKFAPLVALIGLAIWGIAII